MRPDASLRLGIGLAVVATLLAVAGGFRVHWPWLQCEHDRLEPIVRVLIWTADAVTLLWLAWFGLRQGLLRTALPTAAGGDGEFRYLLVSLLLAFGADLWMDVHTALAEHAGRRRAVQAQGHLVGGRATVNRKKAYLVCRFQDRDGGWHESRLQVQLKDQPLRMRNAIQTGGFPIPVSLTYDPEWPPRFWLDGFDNDEGNRLHYMSFSFLLFQGLCLPFAFKLALWSTPLGLVPLYKVIPLWAELLPFCLAAVAKFGEGEY